MNVGVQLISDYTWHMKTVFIAVQNLRIGGFQRVALDEAYAFSSKGFRVVIVVLEKIEEDGAKSFYTSEIDLIQKFDIQLSVVSGSRKQQLISFRSLIRNSDFNQYYISHNLRASVLIRLASIISARKVQIYSVIHQIPSLSDRTQRFKRFLYARTSNKLFIFSAAALEDWNKRIKSNRFLRMLYRSKNIELLRNGVFFERVNIAPALKTASQKRDLRLIFIGRPTFWKGIGTVLALAKTELLLNSKVVLYLPYANDSLFQNLPESLTSRLEIIIGKTFKDYVPKLGDVHLYPADYGSSEFIESISINCLEMAAVGVPSCVTKGGLATWPEFSNNAIIREIEWANLIEASQIILNCSQTQFSDFELEKIRNFISVNTHIDTLLYSLEA
jgi:glycosyltransferase involved in cell wall biosynthesis